MSVHLSYDDGLPNVPADAPEWARSASQRIRQRQQQEQQGQFSGEEKDSSIQQRRRFSRVPKGVTSVLLHSCCAPCSGAMVEEMVESFVNTNKKNVMGEDQEDDEEKGSSADTSNSTKNQKPLKVVVFFYNPNIHPRREYEIRKEENKKYCADLGIDFVDCDYDVSEWYKRCSKDGMEFDAERGRRCTACFDLRMERTALYAAEHGFDAIATTNATSRWKDAAQVDESGRRAVLQYPNLVYWAEDWQTDEMTLRKYQIAAQHRFYKQEYCGCSYSLRDSNAWRTANGISKIQIGGDTAGIGNRYFTNPETDAAEESQDVVDEFFAQANDIAQAKNDRVERQKKLQVYQNRRKNEAHDGVVNGYNNW